MRIHCWFTCVVVLITATPSPAEDQWDYWSSRPLPGVSYTPARRTGNTARMHASIPLVLIEHNGKTPPTEDEVLQELPPFFTANRDYIEIVSERLVDYVEPARTFPIVGRAQLHHLHWKCCVFWTEALPNGEHRRRVEVIYITHDHMHPCDVPRE